jgi:phosphatidylglycerol:prolipoprotein diacylglycerol transferase
MLLRAYATIPDFINAIFGTSIPRFPINTYGFFVALGFIVAAYFVTKELKRKESIGLLKGIEKAETTGTKATLIDILIPLLIGAFFGLKIGGVFDHGLEVITCQQQALSFLFSLEGNKLFAIVFGLAYAAFTYWDINRKSLENPITKKVLLRPHEQIGTIVMVAAITGVLGSNIFDMFQPGNEVQNIFKDPTVLFSGLSIYGGLFFGAIGVILFAKWAKMGPFILVDAVAAPYALASGIGRLGCHFSGDGDWGIANTSAAPSWIPEYFWSNTYAYNVINEGKEIAGCVAENISGCGGDYCYELPIGVWPTSIYEFIMFVFIFLFTWSIRKKFSFAPGFLIFLVLLLNGVERFFIEMIRVTKRYENIFNLTQAQIISIVLVVGSLAGMVYLWNKHKDIIKKTSF